MKNGLFLVFFIIYASLVVLMYWKDKKIPDDLELHKIKNILRLLFSCLPSIDATLNFPLITMKLCYVIFGIFWTHFSNELPPERGNIYVFLPNMKLCLIICVNCGRTFFQMNKRRWFLIFLSFLILYKTSMWSSTWNAFELLFIN